MTNVFNRIIKAIIRAVRKMLNVLTRRTRNLQGEPEFRIIGPRRSGKTTFMAALARWPETKPDSPIESVNPFDDETAILINMAKDILENGLSLAGNRLKEDPNQFPPLYTLLITMKPVFRLGGKIRFQVSCRDFPGEIIEKLRNSTPDAILQNYLDDCANASGLLLLIDGTAREDQKYAQAFENLKGQLNIRLIGQNKNLNSYRIAVVFSKAEQSQVWIYRNDIQKFINLRFPKTQRTIQKWSNDWRCSVNYFFCSAFGMIGSPPKQNVRVETRDAGATTGVIAYPQFWRPFGLVGPIYWLHTGKDDQRLRKMED